MLSSETARRFLMKFFARTVALVTFATLAATAFAQPMPNSGPGKGGPGNPLQQAGLTDDQAKQVNELLDKQRLALVPIDAQIRVLDAQINEALTAAKTDAGAVNALVDRKAKLQADKEKQLYAALAQVRTLVGDQAYLKLLPLIRNPGMGPEGPRGDHPRGDNAEKP
jgi:Spy/CpxP family protein refolding chaperone